MFSSKETTTIISEVEKQQNLLQELKGESAAYAALIQNTIQDLKEANKRIAAEETKTQEIITKLTKTKVELTALKNANLDFISKLEAVYADVLEDPEEDI